MRSLTVVTAADWRYGRCASQLFRSAERHRQDREHHWCFYDLGLRTRQAYRIRQRFPWVEMRSFDFSRYPDHFALERETWAWKVAIIRDVLHQAGGPVLWLDSATILHSSLQDVQEALDRDGVYVLAGNAAVGMRCDTLTLERVNPPLEVLDRPERVAGVIGFDGARADIRELCDQWARLAANPLIIAPRHPRWKHHMPEQSLLSLLLLERVKDKALTLPDAEIDICSIKPVRWMSSRNKVPHWMPEWADVFVRAYWRSYKTLDRVWLRCNAFENDRLSGWYRWPKEHFVVHVATVTGAARRQIRAPYHSYYADPFLLSHEERTYLLLEEFRYDRNSGRIVMLELDASFAPGVPHALGLPEGHASFPCIFSHKEKIYMVPETCSRRCIDLYVFDRFPGEPRLVRRLLYGLDAADSVVFSHEGRIWLITSVRERESDNRFLAIYLCDDLETGALTAHPVNQRRLYGDRRHSWGRCAGRVICEGGRLVRPIHTSTEYYGQSLGWMRIDKLTPDQFDESPESTPPAGLEFSLRENLHHLSTAGDIVAFDQRDRAGYWQGMRSLLQALLSRRQTP